MNDCDRFKLRFGPYRTPRYKIGATVFCDVRGELTIVGTSDGRIAWPMGRRKGSRAGASLVVYRGLAKAVRKESNIAVQHWWGVSPTTVWKWRRALDVPATTEGTSQLRAAHFAEPWAEQTRHKAWSKARDPERRAKIAAARRGKPRPKHVMAALRKANVGRPLSAETQRKMSEAHRRRGTRPPWLKPAWTAEEDALLLTLSPREVAERTGRAITAVWARRRVLGISRRSE